jgi:hypothetical protein
MTDFKAASLTEHFKELKDPRIERTKCHLLGDIIVITICAVICGADNWVEVEEFGRSKQECLGCGQSGRSGPGKGGYTLQRD